MDWRVKAVVQAILSGLPGGGTINDCLQRVVGKRRVNNLETRVNGKLREVRAMCDALGECGFDLRGRRVLEVGTGWEPTVPLGPALLGARVTTLDLRRHLRSTEAVRKSVALALDGYREWLPVAAEAADAIHAFVEQGTEIEALLETMKITYLAPVLDTHLLSMPEAGFDLVYSLAVLEHVPPGDLEVLMKGQGRVLAPGGMAFHDIGLGDHFTSVDPSITFGNFLQFDGPIWRLLGENFLAYHNRLRRSDFAALFRKHGFEEIWSRARVDGRASDAPNSGALRPAPRFRNYDVENLATWRLAVVLCRSHEKH